MKQAYLQIEARYHIIASMLLARSDRELPRATKVKLMNLRIRLSKPVKRFREEMQEAANELMKGEYAGLRERMENWSEQGKTSVEKSRHEADRAAFEKLTDRLNADCEALAKVKYAEEEHIPDIRFTEAEFADIVDVNSLNDVTFPNGKTVRASDLLEAFYDLFVQKKQ
jgi:hypothetical protein